MTRMKRWIFLSLLLIPMVAGILWAERREEMVKGPIRESVIAGSWYPGDPDVLRSQILDFLSRAKPPQIEGELIALISPHAGYMYSGQVAAYAYKLLEGRPFHTVVIVAPSHRAYFRGVSVYPRGGYRTPLGIVPIAEDLTSRLMETSPVISYIPQAHAQEHSLEIQLPFLQVVLKDFRLVPLVMGEHDFHTCQELADAIVEVVKGKEDVLLVASTDLSHFYPYSQAVTLDRVVLEHVEAFDPEGLSKDLRTGRCEACGGGPMVAVMLAARALGADGARVLKYANSGDVTGDRSSVVGYMAAAIYRRGGSRRASDPEERVGVDLGLSEDDKRLLHEIARTVIRNRVLGKPIPDFRVTSPRLREPRGAFVTIKKHGNLRGCIGYVKPIKPLWQAVAEMAEAAAFEDPRFPPVTADELDDLEIEISVLTPLMEVKGSPEEIVRQIQVGKHGIMIERPPYYSGLLLPQVATEYGWDAETFLEQTCLKAGLPTDAWRDPATRIYLFSAEIF